MADHVHIMIAIPPNYEVSKVVWCIKGEGDSHDLGVRGIKEGLYKIKLLDAGGSVSTAAGVKR